MRNFLRGLEKDRIRFNVTKSSLRTLFYLLLI
nr:MAG TPA: hypothetical protein [Caudoviricetes sp.]